MARKLADIFNECYERIRSGESLESCLASYPEHAAELEKLIRTAFDIGRRGSYIQPRPEFRHWTGVRLQGAFEYARRQKQKPVARGFNWSTAWAVALTAIVIVVVSGISTAAAASDAMPDDTLYPVKLATEQARLALTFSESAKAEIHTRLAEKRVIEIETMAAQGKTELATTTAEKLATHLEIASTTIAKIADIAPTELAVTTTVPVTQSTPPPAEESVTTTPSPAPSPKPTPAPEQPTPQKEETTSPTATTEGSAVGTKSQRTTERTKTERAERLRTALENSTSRSLTALRKAMDEASPEARPALQKAIDRISEKGYRRSGQEPDDKDNESKDNADSQEQKDSSGQDANPQQQTAPSPTDKPTNNNQSPSKYQFKPKVHSQ